jgi:hypothetical protein
MDTVNNVICSFNGEQFFDSYFEFAYIFNKSNSNNENVSQLLSRFTSLIPTNYFNDTECKLIKDEIIATNNWYLADYINSHEGYFWKHKSILNDEYTFYMSRKIDTGFTEIIEQGKNDDVPLFEGYILSLEDLITVKRLLKLHEI